MAYTPILSPSGHALISFAHDEHENWGSSELVDQPAAEVLDGLDSVHAWALALLEERAFAPLRAAGRPEFLLDATGSNAQDVLDLISPLYAEPSPRLIDQIDDCVGAVHGAMGNLLGWIEQARHLMRKVSRDATADEIPAKVNPALDEIASSVVQLADRLDLPLDPESLPTVAEVHFLTPLDLG